MSADPFAPGAGDPFAAAPEQQPPASEPTPVEAEQPPAAPPIVDREGEPVAETPVADDGGTAEVGQPPAPDPAATPPQPEPTVPTEAQPESPGQAVDVQTAPAPEEPPAAPQEAAQPPQEAQTAETPAEQPAPPAAPAEAPQQTAPASAADQQAAAESDEAPAPATGGKSPLRHYALLYQSGEGQWTEYDLTTLAESLKVHTEVKDGVCYLKARNADHARRIAWIIFGRPENGVTVNPVAKSSWNPKRLAPAPPAPERERLSIT